MEEAYQDWIAVLTIGGLFGVSVIGYVLWKSCNPTYLEAQDEEV
jgi:hypothetical protein